jgi:hypothetical protein
MGHPNRDRRSNASRYRGTTQGGHQPRWFENASHKVTEQARKALGLGLRDKYAKDETAQGVLPDGRPVKLVAAPSRSGERRLSGRGLRTGMGMRRIQVLCDQCNHWIPVGRIEQHEGTATCLRMRNKTRKSRDPQTLRSGVKGGKVTPEFRRGQAFARRSFTHGKPNTAHTFASMKEVLHDIRTDTSDYDRAKREALHFQYGVQHELNRQRATSRDPGQGGWHVLLVHPRHGTTSAGTFKDKAAALRKAKKLRDEYEKHHTSRYKVQVKKISQTGTMRRAERGMNSRYPLASKPSGGYRARRDLSRDDLREMSIQALGRMLIKALRSGHDALAHQIEKEIDRRSRR